MKPYVGDKLQGKGKFHPEESWPTDSSWNSKITKIKSSLQKMLIEVRKNQ